jgi:PAS domain S-box-containing protein
MSMNEEFQSANEKLATSKEELQSLNEELSTLNNQLQDKVEELERSNNDIVNLLSNTDICSIVLDRSMRIKLFTPPSAGLFNLRATDMGRPLGDFSPNFSDDALLADAQAVLEKLVPLKGEVQTGDGRDFLRRIQPYRIQDNRIDGVVITFVDITTWIQAEQRLRDSEAQLKELNKVLEQRVAERTTELSQRELELRTLAANVPAMFSYVDSDEVYRYVNRLYGERHSSPVEQIVGKSVRGLLGPENYATAKPHIDMALAGETQRYEAAFEFPGGVRTMDVTYVPDKDAEGRIKGFFALVHDISERKALERRLHDSEERLRAIVGTAADGIITVDREGVIRDFNPAAERMFGRPAAAVINQDVRLILPPSCGDCIEYPECFRTGRCLRVSAHPQELIGCRADGTLFPMEITVSEIDYLDLYVVLVRDTSERKALEREIIDASTVEQERIGRDIHDGIGQQLTALAMLASSIEHRLSGTGHSDEAKEVKKLVKHLQDALAETRALARGLSPVEIVPEGLADALSELAESVRSSSGVQCRCLGVKSAKVPDKNVAAHLYRIAQEAIHNAVRHGRPSKVEVRLVSDDHGLVLSVQDDGTGIEQVDKRVGRLGLQIMRYRADIIGGELTVRPAANGGSLVQCVIPKR